MSDASVSPMHSMGERLTMGELEIHQGESALTGAG